VVELGFNYRIDEARAAMLLRGSRGLDGGQRPRRRVQRPIEAVWVTLKASRRPCRRVRGSSANHLFKVVVDESRTVEDRETLAETEDPDQPAYPDPSVRAYDVDVALPLTEA